MQIAKNLKHEFPELNAVSLTESNLYLLARCVISKFPFWSCDASFIKCEDTSELAPEQMLAALAGARQIWPSVTPT